MLDLKHYIDQTILKPSATKTEILDFLHDVEKYEFYAGVVNPCWVELARHTLPAHIKVCSVVGFPLGASSIRTKVFATDDLIKMGCDEIDMVLNIGQLIDKNYSYLKKEISLVVKAAAEKTVKVIIETCLLDDELKKAAARIIIESKAHFVKTSTGFSNKGADVHDVKLLRKVVGPEFGVKASGGIRDHIFARELIMAGANRIGTSSGVFILKGAKTVKLNHLK
jgi:deoxyribose-phosphate aldolase